MKLYTLSDDVNVNCYLLRACGCTLMLECPLDFAVLGHFMPLPPRPSTKLHGIASWQNKELNANDKEDVDIKESGKHFFINSVPELAPPEIDRIPVEEIDFVLISNYQSMLALPFITECPRFRGVVYLTEPTFMLGKLLMEDLVECFESGAVQNCNNQWKNWLTFLPPPLRTQVDCFRWKQCYTLSEVQRSLTKVNFVNHEQTVSFCGKLTFTATSSGWGIGSCNWVLDINHSKVSYVSMSSLTSPHAKPLDTKSLRNSSVMILSGLSPEAVASPQNKLVDFCTLVENTMRKGGNVLVPCHLTDTFFDMLDTLALHLESRGLTGVPVYVASPMAPDLLGHANIFCEWMTDERRVRVFIGNSPFENIQQMYNRKLKAYSKLHGEFSNELDCPCVMFTTHPSMRFGFSTHFIEVWGQDPRNTVIFTEPGYDYIQSLAPYQPLQLKVVMCPIECRLTPEQVNGLLQEWKPNQILLHPSFLQTASLQAQHSNLVVDAGKATVYTLSKSKVIQIKIPRLYEEIVMDPDLARSFTPTEIQPGVGISLVAAKLEHQKAGMQLKRLMPEDSLKLFKRSKEQAVPSLVFGKIDAYEFAKQLEQQGLGEVKVEKIGSGYMIHIASEDTLIQLEEGSTHIISQGSEELRIRLKDTLLKMLKKF